MRSSKEKVGEIFLPRSDKIHDGMNFRRERSKWPFPFPPWTRKTESLECPGRKEWNLIMCSGTWSQISIEHLNCYLRVSRWNRLAFSTFALFLIALARAEQKRSATGGVTGSLGDGRGNHFGVRASARGTLLAFLASVCQFSLDPFVNKNPAPV